MICSLTVVSVSALNIYDNDGNLVGTSKLTNSGSVNVFHLEVEDLIGSRAYGAIYLYDSNGNMIDGGWEGYSSYVELTKGYASSPVAHKAIRSSVQGYEKEYYSYP